jgi:uncharacterized membrane protein (DUF4010 family)
METTQLLTLIVALAIGLVVGLERGWRYRDAEEGDRVAGLRTFGLIGLLGGIVGLIAGKDRLWLVGLVFLGLAIVLVAAYVVSSRDRSDIGVTSEVAALITYLLGVLAGLGHLAIAAAAAIVLALLLNYKAWLHERLVGLRPDELAAVLKLLLISVVLLPILPDRGFGPGNAVNPYLIWWMVVLIAAISFAGYIAIRLTGARRGVVLTGLAGGLASSTAVTLAFARMARADDRLVDELAAGTLLACGTMFPRMALVSAVIHPPLFALLWLPATVMALATYLPVTVYLNSRANPSGTDEPAAALSNPLALRSALGFGALLAVVMVLGWALEGWAGDAGIWLLAAASGVADVDAITLSLARMGSDELAPRVAVIGMVIAAAVNSLFKGSLALVIGGKGLGWRVLGPLLIASIFGLGLAIGVNGLA